MKRSDQLTKIEVMFDLLSQVEDGICKHERKLHKNADREE